MKPKYQRILIKLSGEALAGDKGVGIDITTVQSIAKEIAEVHNSGVEIALVIGGGNLWRGEPAAEAGMDRVQADYTGMLGTVMNALVMADSLQHYGVDTVCRQLFQCKTLQSLIFEVVRFVIWKRGALLFSVLVLGHLIFQQIRQRPYVLLRLRQMLS